MKRLGGLVNLEICKFCWEMSRRMWHNFGLHYGLTKPFRQNLVRKVCEDKYVTCKRLKPIVFSSPVAVENGTTVGFLSIREDEELADAVRRFSRQTNITRDLQVSLLQALAGRAKGFCALGAKRSYGLRQSVTAVGKFWAT
jgi:hypothetical protein